MAVDLSAKNTPKSKIIVPIGDLLVSDNQAEVLTTYGLGSCVGVVIYDPQAEVSGLLHTMLPDSTLSPEKSRKRPAVFADTGMEALLKEFERKGGSIDRSSILLAGGGETLGENNYFNIGRKNCDVIKGFLKETGLEIAFEDVGGNNNRTLDIKTKNGEVTIKTASDTKTFKMK